MKYLFLTLFSIFCFLTHAQKDQVVLNFLIIQKPYNLTNCLNNLTDDATLQLTIIEGDESMIQSFKILVSLEDNNQFKQTQLIGLLSGNKCFSELYSHHVYD